MAFPDVSDVLGCFEESITFKEVTVINNADYKRETTTVNTTKKAVIQNARPQDLKLDNLDYSLNYIQIHTKYSVDINDIVTWNGTDYKIINVIDQSNRGFYESVGEQIR